MTFAIFGLTLIRPFGTHRLKTHWKTTFARWSAVVNWT
jgi:hypothetical protein